MASGESVPARAGKNLSWCWKKRVGVRGARVAYLLRRYYNACRLQIFHRGDRAVAGAVAILPAEKIHGK
jgi:hypothetical protein